MLIMIPLDMRRTFINQQKEECDLICKEINNLLESEEYAMKKHFKY